MDMCLIVCTGTRTNSTRDITLELRHFSEEIELELRLIRTGGGGLTLHLRGAEHLIGKLELPTYMSSLFAHKAILMYHRLTNIARAISSIAI